jgi:hypothetical protein
MQNTLKTKAAGAGADQTPDSTPDVLKPITDGPVASAAQPDATPPDIIVEI